MPSPEPPPNDDLDDIFEELDSGRPSNNRPGHGGTGNTTTLGIDEEVTVARKRQPTAKLDEARLLSAAGIPRLRRISKNLKFKGKGHEYSDIANLLGMYQLWLDDLYPKAKFADGLAIIEKVGHSKRMQTMRKTWIDEGKPKQPQETEAGLEEQVSGSRGERQVTADSRPTQVNAGPSQAPGEPDEDELDALMDDAISATRAVPTAPSGRVGELDFEQPDDDELDALLAEEMGDLLAKESMDRLSSGQPSHHLSPHHKKLQDDDFADEMEAMEESGIW